MSKTKIIALVVLIIALCAGSAVASSDMNVTYVFCDDVEHRVFSLSADPYEIVAKAGVVLEEDDQLVLDYFDSSKGGTLIMVAKPHDVLIYEGEQLTAVVNVAGTVGTALDKAGIKLNDGDKLNYDRMVGITATTHVKITRSYPVTVKVDGEEIRVNVTGGTVADVLREAGISLGQYDKVSRRLTKEIKGEMSFSVTRINYRYETKTVKTDYKTKYEYDETMYEDQKKVRVKGKKGKSTNEYKHTYIDGKLKKSEVLSSKVVSEPVTQIIVRGTKVRSTGYTGASVKSGKVISELKPPFEIPLNKNGRPTEYKKVITGKATAYCGGGITSTGAPAMPGRVAVDPREIPYGTKMYIVSSDGKWNYGYCIASDTGGFIYTSSTVVDIYMHSYTDCRNFGRRNVDIYILEWGNGIQNWKTH